MTSRERVKRALHFGKPDRPPREIWALPGVVNARKDEWERFLARFPMDTESADARYGGADRNRSPSYEVGKYTDAWGCVWTVAEYGVIGEVKDPPLADWAALASYRMPWELLREADFGAVNPFCAKTGKYVKGGGETRPFERMQFLRGTENLYIDLAYGTKEAYKLRDMLHEFFCEEMRRWAATDVDGIAFMDDWGSNRGLLINPEMWREFYKPLYRDYCRIIRGAGKDVWFHSDGNIEAIYSDLIEIGVTALNSQLFCMNIEELGRMYRGKVTFWGELDRQHTLPFGTPDEVRAAVRRVRQACETPDGGVTATFEWGKRDPYENVAAACEEWEKPYSES